MYINSWLVGEGRKRVGDIAQEIEDALTGGHETKTRQRTKKNAQAEAEKQETKRETSSLLFFPLFFPATTQTDIKNSCTFPNNVLLYSGLFCSVLLCSVLLWHCIILQLLMPFH